MKKIIGLVLINIATCVYAQIQSPQHEWHISLHVVDEAGAQVVGANASVGYFKNTIGTSADGLTDTNGNFSASNENAFGGTFGLVAKKSGYYATRQSYIMPPEFDVPKWNPNITLVLKKIEKPIPLYAMHVLNLTVPDTKTPIGYDLMIGDWVGPYGKGTNSDMLFTKELGENGRYYKLIVSFPNKGDGIQVLDVPDYQKGSALRSPHNAPSANYQNKLTRETGKLPRQRSKFEYDPTRVYLIRVRSIVDSEGNLVSALYGKIYGDFMTFTFYLNPTPNDRNIEFDQNHNLINSRVAEP